MTAASGSVLVEYTGYAKGATETVTAEIESTNGLWIETSVKGYIYKVIWSPVPTKEVVSTVTTIESVTVNGEAISAENLAALAGEGHTLNLEGKYAAAPAVVFNTKTVITYDDDTTESKEEAVNATVAAGESCDYVATATVADVLYTINFTSNVHTYTLKWGNANNGWGDVYAYVWSADEANRNAGWPGEKMEGPDADGVYTYTFTPDGWTPAFVVFGDNYSGQTDNLAITCDESNHYEQSFGVRYSDWWINLPGDHNGWENNGVQPVDGVSTHVFENGVEGGFKVKIWNGGNIWLGNGKTLEANTWYDFSEGDGNMTFPEAAKRPNTKVEFKCATREIRVVVEAVKLAAPAIARDGNTVTITAPEGAELYYSNNGTVPGVLSNNARSGIKADSNTVSFTVNSACVVKAVAVGDGSLTSDSDVAELNVEGLGSMDGYLLYWNNADNSATYTAEAGSVLYSGTDNPSRLNYANKDYLTICLSTGGKVDDIRMNAVLNENLKAGDIISITAFRNKGDDSKKSGALLKFANDQTVKIGDGSKFIDLGLADNADKEPNTISHEVTEAEAGGNTIGLTRSTTQTNLFITELSVVAASTTHVCVGFNNAAYGWTNPYVKFSLDGGKGYVQRPMEKLELQNYNLYYAADTEGEGDAPATQEIWTALIPDNATHVTFTDGGNNAIDKVYTEIANNNVYDGTDQITTGVEDVEVASENAPAVYYNMQGVRVAQPTAGAYIVVRGSKVAKEIIR